MIVKTEKKVRRLITALEDEEDEFLIAEIKTSIKAARKRTGDTTQARDDLLREMGEQAVDPEKLELVKQYASQIRHKLLFPTFEQKRNIFDALKLECVYRVDDTGRWIDAKCDLLPEGVVIALCPSSIASRNYNMVFRTSILLENKFEKIR